MIEVRSREQFARAAEKLQKERMKVRRLEPGFYEIRNLSKSTLYHVRLSHHLGKVFGACTCKAGRPDNPRRVPQVCKHLLSAILFHRALVRMRRAAAH